MIKYKWAKIGNLYTIFNVPIFGASVLRGVNKDNLEAIVKTFQNDKVLKSYLPRIFLGHNISNEDRRGIGFLDGLYLDKYIYANFIDIPEDAFQELYNGGYPYHSVEYLQNEITGLALLDSCQPHFKFPRRVLERKGVNLPEIYSRRITMDGNPEKNIQSKEVIKQEEFHDQVAHIEEMLEKLVSVLQPTQKYTDEVDPGEVLKNMINSIEDGALTPASEAVLEGVLSKEELAELLEMAKQEIKSKTPDAKEEDIQELAKGFIYSKNFYDKLLEAPKQPKANVNLDEEVGFKKLYQRLANKNKLSQMGLDDAETQKAEAILEKFSTQKDVGLFLDFLGKKENFGRHPAQHVADGWSCNKPSNFESLSPQKAKIALRAKQAWLDTANHSNPKTSSDFKKQWPTEEMFVKHVLTMSESNPRYLDSLVVEE